MNDMEFDEKGELIESRPTGHEGPWTDQGHIVIEQDNPRWRKSSDDQMRGSVKQYNNTAMQQKGAISKLTQSLKNLIKGADTRFSTHHKKGKLDTRRLWAHRSSDRVFTKPKVLPKFNLACVVLIDASGSMGGQRAQRAAEAAVTLAEVLEKVGAVYEVVDFNSSSGGVEHKGTEYSQGATYMNMRKRVTDSVSSSKVKAQIAMPYAGSQNSDGFAVKWAIDRCSLLATTTEGAQKLVFIISDGAPAGPAPRGMRAGQHLDAVLKDAEGGDTSLFSVGIDGMETERWYGHHGWATIANADNLAADIIVPLKVCLKKAARKVVNG
jgi:cobalamin biosynthesis protein CobT